MTIAFNLGIFFRNLHGQEVSFSGVNEYCTLDFTGGVESLVEQTNLTKQLEVILSNLPLFLHFTFEEPQDDEDVKGNEVRIRLVRRETDEDVTLLETRFLFSEVSLKPTSDDDDDPLPSSA